MLTLTLTLTWTRLQLLRGDADGVAVGALQRRRGSARGKVKVHDVALQHLAQLAEQRHHLPHTMVRVMGPCAGYRVSRFGLWAGSSMRSM